MYPTGFSKLGLIKIIDSTTITLCLEKYGWATFSKQKAGVKIHLRSKFVDPNHVFPEKAVITPAIQHDRRQLDSLVDESSAMYVFDRGYVDYRRFDDMCKSGRSFSTRLRDKAGYDVVEEHQIAEGSPILRDTRVIIGHPKRPSRMTHETRRIEVMDNQGDLIVILTNRFDIPAEEIADLYRNRWKIELFFKFIKQNLRMTRFYGTSEKEKKNQIYIGLIAYMLLFLLRMKCSTQKAMLYIQDILKELLWEPWTRMEEAVHRPPTRKSKGRQKKREKLTTSWSP